MKKILVLFAILAGISFGSVASASLWSYYAEKGENLPSVSVRTPLAKDCGITNYLGKVEQNNALEKCLRGDEILGATNPVAGATYTLAGSGITSSATSITLTSLTIPQTGYELVDADFSSTFYITLEPGNQKKQEIVSCTTVTQNANNTATLSGCTRGLLPYSPYTADSDYAFAHAGGTSVIFSDAPQLFNEYTSKSNDETITGGWSFPLPLSSDTFAPATVGYANALAFVGAPDMTPTTKGIGEQATAVEIASSTLLGDTTAPLVVTTPYTTSTITVRGPGYIPATTNAGYIDKTFGGSADSLATLDSNTLVTQNPASATVTPTASSIPIADASGDFDVRWGKFGGTGVDGALDTNSGVVNIDLLSQATTTKNYTSINIASNNLTFTNPHSNGSLVTLRSQGDCTISASIIANFGAAGGATSGLTGSKGQGYLFYFNNGTGGASGPTAGVGGGATPVVLSPYSNAVQIASGGGGGAGWNNTPGTEGAGGRGGGGLYIECAGALNFTGTINANGTNGGNGTGGNVTEARGGGGGGASITAGINGVTDSGAGNPTGAGGGGGGGGTVVILYRTLTASSGSITVAGGTKGTSGSAATGGNGGNGTYSISQVLYFK